MQTNLADFIRDTHQGKRANEILRSCVHCGFCTATCPTYQLLGDELDGPRGRIYLIKQVLEGEPATSVTRDHLDRCLTCRNCETTCPSGVKYGELLDIGREVVEQQAPRSLLEQVTRWVMRNTFTSPSFFSGALGAGRLVSPLVPDNMRHGLAEGAPAGAWPTTTHNRHVVTLAGCVQGVMAPRINAASARVLNHFGVTLKEVSGSTCCGAINHHLSAHDEALTQVRANVDAWCTALDDGADAIVITASGCGSMVRDYARLLADDEQYREKAARVTAHVKDLAEFVGALDIDGEDWTSIKGRDVAYHPPCTLQHGQSLPGVVEGILRRVGVELKYVSDSHLCCGSAGTYSLTQPKLSTQLRDNKLANLTANEPSEILSANIGCIHHLGGASKVPVRHWVELLDDALA